MKNQIEISQMRRLLTTDGVAITIRTAATNAIWQHEIAMLRMFSPKFKCDRCDAGYEEFTTHCHKCLWPDCVHPFDPIRATVKAELPLTERFKRFFA